MDPNAALQIIREAFEAFGTTTDTTEAIEAAGAAADAFSDLDAWLRGGGFPPEDWPYNRP